MQEGEEQVKREIRMSVVIPAHNAEATIGDAIASAWASGAFEVIVVNDGSEDDTAVVASRSGCRLLRQQRCGASSARRLGVASALGDVVVLLDADDILIPTGMAQVLDHLSREESIDLVAAGHIAFGRSCGAWRVEPWREEVTLEELLRRGRSVGPPAAIVWRRAALMESLGESPPGLWPGYAEDYETLIRAAFRWKIGTHSAIICKYRLGVGKSSKRPFEAGCDAERIRRYYARLWDVPITRRSDRELRALSMVRRAYDTPGHRFLFRRLMFYVFAVLIDPPLAKRGMVSARRRLTSSANATA